MTDRRRSRRVTRPGTVRLGVASLAMALLSGAGAAAAVTTSPGASDAAATTVQLEAPADGLAPPPSPVVADPPPGWPTPSEPDAAAYLLVDATTGQVLAGRDEDVRRPVASTIKLLTALSVVQRAELDEEVTVGADVEDVPGASVSLAPGDVWTVEELLVGLLVRSGNDAAEAIAAHVGGDVDGFVALMRADATALGLEVAPGDDDVAPVEGPVDGPVRVGSVSGLDDVNALSALDLAVLARATLDDPDLRAIVGAPSATLPGVGTDDNRNLLIGSYPGATGLKTGFTSAAGNSVVGSAARDGRELIAIVLDGGEDPERFDAAAALLDHGFAAFAVAEPQASRSLLVAGGRVTVTAASGPITVPRDADVDMVLDLPVRPDGAPLTAAVHVDDDRVAGVAPQVADERPEPVDGAAGVGRAAVDGVHAALRATCTAPAD